MERDKKIQAVMALFHKSWLNRIKKELGKKCTFISHMTRKTNGNTEYCILVHLKNDTGGKDKITYKIGTNPDNISEKDYMSLLNMLKKGEYDRRSEEVLSGTN